MMSNFQLGLLLSSVVWIACFLAYAWQVRHDREAMNKAIAELADAIAEHARGNGQQRAHLLEELDRLERIVRTPGG